VVLPLRFFISPMGSVRDSIFSADARQSISSLLSFCSSQSSVSLYGVFGRLRNYT